MTALLVLGWADEGGQVEPCARWLVLGCAAFSSSLLAVDVMVRGGTRGATAPVPVNGTGSPDSPVGTPQHVPPAPTVIPHRTKASQSQSEDGSPNAVPTASPRRPWPHGLLRGRGRSGRCRGR
jgi:hypothetical protein